MIIIKKGDHTGCILCVNRERSVVYDLSSSDADRRGIVSLCENCAREIGNKIREVMDDGR